MRKNLGVVLIVIGLLIPAPYVYLKYIHSDIAGNSLLGWSVAAGIAIAAIGAQMYRRTKS